MELFVRLDSLPLIDNHWPKDLFYNLLNFPCLAKCSQSLKTMDTLKNQSIDDCRVSWEAIKPAPIPTLNKKCHPATPLPLVTLSSSYFTHEKFIFLNNGFFIGENICIKQQVSTLVAMLAQFVAAAESNLQPLWSTCRSPHSRSPQGHRCWWGWRRESQGCNVTR